MGSAQSTILPYGQPIGFAGLVTRRLDAFSAVNSEATLNIGYGLGVKPGTLLKEILLPTAAGSILEGITINNYITAPGQFGGLDQENSPSGIRINRQIEILRIGRIWVRVDADSVIVPNITRAYMRFESDNGSNTVRGTFRTSDDGHVADVRGQVLFVSGVFPAADILSGGTVKIAEVAVDTTGRA